jgi:hypothetical protein
MRAAFSLSLSTKRANSGCVILIGSAPCFASRLCISGAAGARAMSFASLPTTSAGVPADTHTPYQSGNRSQGHRRHGNRPPHVIQGPEANWRAVRLASVGALPPRLYGPTGWLKDGAKLRKGVLSSFHQACVKCSSSGLVGRLGRLKGIGELGGWYRSPKQKTVLRTE